jgi:hypothetical protein
MSSSTDTDLLHTRNSSFKYNLKDSNLSNYSSLIGNYMQPWGKIRENFNSSLNFNGYEGIAILKYLFDLFLFYSNRIILF